MDVTHSKNAFFHWVIRRGLQSGRYIPGQRIDPAKLAAEHNASPTPVRNALFRLAGQGLLVEHARGGLFVPIPTESILRDLYDGMRLMSENAIDHGLSSPSQQRPRIVPPISPQDDPVKRTWQLFDAIGRATGHRFIHCAIKHANDKLAPIRRAKQLLIEDSAEELAELILLWEEKDASSLKTAIRTYHQRRRDLVPVVVALLNERRG